MQRKDNNPFTTNSKTDGGQSINYLVKRSNISSINVKFIQFVDPYYKTRCCEWFDCEQPVYCLKNFLEIQLTNLNKPRTINFYFLNSKLKVSDIFPLNEHRTEVIKSIINQNCDELNTSNNNNPSKNPEKKEQLDQPNLKLLSYSTKLRNITPNTRAIIIYDVIY
mgnify:CR=1 FL=1